jgi:glycosyltransferase involved in cell wall biosynthesis
MRICFSNIEEIIMERKLVPRITIVMPSLNQARYIEESIQSILDQNYPSLEFMILDGGSTDGSQEIIERYADRLTYWHSRPDKGQTDALIHGFERATGDLMGWVNSDDILLPRALHSIALSYVSNPEGGLFGGNYVLIDQGGRIIRFKRHPANADWFARGRLFAVNQPGSFFKRQDYEAVGGLHADLHYVMDTDLYIRMLANGTRYVYINAWLSGFRKHAMAKTVAQATKAHREFEVAQRHYWPQTRLNLVWQCSYVAWQVVNGNYFRMSIETLLSRGRYWRVWTSRHCSGRPSRYNR